MAKRRCIEAYLSRLFGYALSLTNDREEARDLVQDCALKVLVARRQPADEPAFRAWLFRILRNLHIDRRRRPIEATLGEERIAEILDDAAVDGYHDHLLTAVTVRNAMAQLSEPHREIIGLVDLAGFTYAEAGALLEVPAGTVMSRLSRARRALLEAVAAGNIQPLPMSRRRARK